jgi:hypothetical protein
LDFEYVLSLETQLNYKNGFERKNLLGNQFTFGPTAQAKNMEALSFFSYFSNRVGELGDSTIPKELCGGGSTRLGGPFGVGRIQLQ